MAAIGQKQAFVMWPFSAKNNHFYSTFIDAKRTFVMSANLVPSVVKKAANQAWLAWACPKGANRLVDSSCDNCHLQLLISILKFSWGW